MTEVISPNAEVFTAANGEVMVGYPFLGIEGGFDGMANVQEESSEAVLQAASSKKSKRLAAFKFTNF